MKEKLLTIFNHYEPKTQRNKLCEEFRELQDELHEIYDNDKLSDNLVSEIADNFILMLQFAYDNEITLEEIEKEMKYKINRQLERLKNNEYIKTFNSSREASKLLNISETSISNCVNGYSKTA